jgi:ABC-type sugar transport system substrate-binding protein
MKFCSTRARLALAVSMVACSFFASSCDRTDGSGKRTVGVAFETLQTPYWVASFEAIKKELATRGVGVVEAIADGDANRQLEQVRSFIARRVDGIIVAPKDASTVIPMIKAAERAKIPIVLYNRPARDTETKSVAVVADNFALSRDTVRVLADLARKRGGKSRAMILIGDLGDLNAVERRRGFDAAIAENKDIIEVVAEIPTEWNQETALHGVTNALSAHPDIDFIFTSSDFLLPSLVSALESAGKYRKFDQPGHVLLGGFDGDAKAYEMLVDGYLDATGVQDVYFECAASVQAVLDLADGKQVESLIRDPGFVIHRENRAEMEARMWGAQVHRSSRK